jgi:hypothetical protein
MREFVRGVCCLVILAAIVAPALFWFADRPDAAVWLGRIGSPLAILAGFLCFYLARQPADEVPDYLFEAVGPYFDRGGFCFTFRLGVKDGSCYMHAYFQNRHGGPCRGRIALRPASSFFLTRPRFEAIAFDIECGPAAFGVASIPLPIPKKSQGKKQKFEVGASVEYPDGRGRRLRHRLATVVRANSKFGDAFRTGLVAAGALAGMVVLSSPASVVLHLPPDVAEDPPEGRDGVVETFWMLGDPPFDGGLDGPGSWAARS